MFSLVGVVCQKKEGGSLLAVKRFVFYLNGILLLNINVMMLLLLRKVGGLIVGWFLFSFPPPPWRGTFRLQLDNISALQRRHVTVYIPNGLWKEKSQ